jgi:hypothetical protein
MKWLELKVACRDRTREGPTGMREEHYFFRSQPAQFAIIPHYLKTDVSATHDGKAWQ